MHDVHALVYHPPADVLQIRPLCRGLDLTTIRIKRHFCEGPKYERRDTLEAGRHLSERSEAVAWVRSFETLVALSEMLHSS